MITGIATLGVTCFIIYDTKTATLVVHVVTCITTFLPAGPRIYLVVTAGFISHIIAHSATNTPQKSVFGFSQTAGLGNRIIK